MSIYIEHHFKAGNICILGCGHGYDAIMFSEQGFSVTAVDFAPSPINYIIKKAAELSLHINTVQENIFSCKQLAKLKYFHLFKLGINIVYFLNTNYSMMLFYIF